METNETQEIESKNAARETAADETVVDAGAETTAADVGAEAFVPDDELTERAIRAGMSLADVRSCPSKAFAERMIGAFEKSAAKPADGSKADGDEFPAINMEGFDEENGYDPTLTRIVNSMKSAIEAQAKVIAKLKSGKSVSPELQRKAIEARKNIVIARPGGEGGTKTGVPKDPNDAVVAELRRKYKLN